MTEIQTLLIKIENSKQNLDNEIFIKQSLVKIINLIEGNILKEFYHKFEPQGLTYHFVLGESHISYHSWPEKNGAIIDLTFCKKINEDLILNQLIDDFGGLISSEMLCRKL